MNALVLGIFALALAVVGSAVLITFQQPRYQIVEGRGMVLRLDTRTGNMDVYTMSTDAMLPPTRKVILYRMTD